MNKEFTKLFSYTEKLRSRYINTLNAFNVYDSIGELTASNIIGEKKAKNNVKTLGSFRYFFIITKESLRCYFLIELAKFFDTSTRSLTVYEVLKYAEKNIDKFSKKDFLEYHKGREILPELFVDYKQLVIEDLEKIKEKLNKNKIVIENLKKYRNQYLAHDDIKKIKVKITIAEIEKLLQIIKEIISLLYSRLEFSVNSYVNFEESSREDTKRLLEYLQKFEEYKERKLLFPAGEKFTG